MDATSLCRGRSGLVRQQWFLDLTDPYSDKPVIMVSSFSHRAETGQGPRTSFGTSVFRELTGRDVAKLVECVGSAIMQQAYHLALCVL